MLHASTKIQVYTFLLDRILMKIQTNFVRMKHSQDLNHKF